MAKVSTRLANLGVGWLAVLLPRVCKDRLMTASARLAQPAHKNPVRRKVDAGGTAASVWLISAPYA